MCRIRALGSRARGDKRSVVKGLAGGLNLSFRVKDDTESEVLLTPASKGQKSEIVDIVVKASPVYEDAFRFETACRRGHYIAFLPPSDFRVIPFLSKEDDNVIDFVLVDFSATLRFKDLEEVLLPLGNTRRGNWVPLSEFIESADVKTYFEKVLQKPVWEAEDFAAYFEGHWVDWEYKADDQTVRMRPLEERLGLVLRSAQTTAEVVLAVQHAGDELHRLPLFGIVRTMQLLATDAQLESNTDALDHTKAQKKFLKALSNIQLPATTEGEMLPTLQQILEAAEGVPALVGEDPTRDLLEQRKAAIQFFTEIAVDQVIQNCKGQQPFEVHVNDIKRLLNLPGIVMHDERLKPTCALVFAKFKKEELLQVLHSAATRGCPLIADAAVASATAGFDNLTPDEGAKLLQSLAEVGACARDIAGLLKIRAHAISASALATVMLAICDHGVPSNDLEVLVSCLIAKAPFRGLSGEVVVGLALAVAKNPAFRPILNYVVETAITLEDWDASAFINLLLAVAKEKNHLQPDIKDALFHKSEGVVTPQLANLTIADLVKITLVVSCNGLSRFMEAIGKEVIIRLPDFSQAQLLSVTQGLAQGLSGGHAMLWKIWDFWSEILVTRNSGSSTTRTCGDGDVGQLSTDQLARFMVAMAMLPSGSVEDGAKKARHRFVEAAGACIMVHAKELPDSSRLMLVAQLKPGGSLVHLSRRAELLTTLEKLGHGRDRSRSCNHKKKKRKKSGN